MLSASKGIDRRQAKQTQNDHSGNVLASTAIFVFLVHAVFCVLYWRIAVVAPQGTTANVPYHKRAGIRTPTVLRTEESWIRAHSHIAPRLRVLAWFHAAVAVVLPSFWFAIGDSAWLEIAFWFCFHGGLLYFCWLAYAGQQVARSAE